MKLVSWILLFSVGSNALAETKLPQHVQDVFQNRCISCHTEEEIDFPLTLEDMTKDDWLDPMNPTDGKLYNYLFVKETMPKKSDKANREAYFKNKENELLKTWIESVKPQEAKPFSVTSVADMDERIFDDIRKIKPAAEQSNYRYISLASLAGKGASPERMKQATGAISKLLNSLSWKKEIKNPVQVGDDGQLLRIDLRDYDWSPGTWEKIVDSNPNAQACDGATSDALRKTTKSKSPSLPGEWFLAHVSTPPLYDEILGLPEDSVKLEERLGLNIEGNIEKGAMDRAGMRAGQSKVSKHNRIVERHDSQFGSYWKSYDFDNSVGDKNILVNPLGPQMKGEKNFHHLGGEIIFSLPNGLQGYYLAEIQRSNGKVVEKHLKGGQGPRNIVEDPKRKDGLVTNGTSCMRCHAGGIIDFKDDVRLAFSNDKTALGDQVRKIYRSPDDKKFNEKIQKDKDRYKDAVEKTGAAYGQDFVSEFTNTYNDDELSLDDAAAELGVPPEVLKKKILENNVLNERLKLLIVGIPIKRKEFEEAFPAANKLLDGCPTLSEKGNPASDCVVCQKARFETPASISELETLNRAILAEEAKKQRRLDALEAFKASGFTPDVGECAWIMRGQNKKGLAIRMDIVRPDSIRADEYFLYYKNQDDQQYVFNLRGQGKRIAGVVSNLREIAEGCQDPIEIEKVRLKSVEELVKARKIYDDRRQIMKEIASIVNRPRFTQFTEGGPLHLNYAEDFSYELYGCKLFFHRSAPENSFGAAKMLMETSLIPRPESHNTAKFNVQKVRKNKGTSEITYRIRTFDNLVAFTHIDSQDDAEKVLKNLQKLQKSCAKDQDLILRTSPK